MACLNFALPVFYYRRILLPNLKQPQPNTLKSGFKNPLQRLTCDMDITDVHVFLKLLVKHINAQGTELLFRLKQGQTV